jgi:uncharacterized protein YbjT (DUF2867 family)
VQPVHVDDVADLALICAQAPVSGTVDAIGPERFAFKDFFRRIAAAVRPRILFVPMPPVVAIAFGRVIGLALGDVLLTADELRGLMQGLLTSWQTPNGKIVFSKWLQENREKIGRSYASEIKRHYKWKKTG